LTKNLHILSKIFKIFSSFALNLTFNIENLTLEELHFHCTTIAPSFFINILYFNILRKMIALCTGSFSIYSLISKINFIGDSVLIQFRYRIFSVLLLNSFSVSSSFFQFCFSIFRPERLILQQFIFLFSVKPIKNIITKIFHNINVALRRNYCSFFTNFTNYMLLILKIYQRYQWSKSALSVVKTGTIQKKYFFCNRYENYKFYKFYKFYESYEFYESYKYLNQSNQRF